MKSSSLAGRAVLAVALMIGFYLLALAIAGGLLYIPYAEVTYGHRIYFKLTLACIIGALAILWAVLPRVDRFAAPGPRLTRERHPRLFAEIERVAQAVHQDMPAEVYLVADVNAWVSQRGGLMGFGSRRVMGLGLALMRVLTRAQLRAVLAHEFGHYHGGDTQLGPWIYKTRGAIGRTLASLSGEKGQGSLLQLPFLWYGKMFLRITHAISRRQEFQADELAARTIGAQPLIDGLRTVHGVGPLFGAYWARECVPVLQAGFRPPLSDGFGQFVGAAPISAAIQSHLQEEMEGGKADPYDTHPPLKERIAAVAALPAGKVEADDPLAISLLEGVAELESELLTSLGGPDQAKSLRPIAWNEVSAKVYLPLWSRLVRTNAAALAGLTPESLPARAADLKALGRTFVNPAGERPEAEEVEGLAAAVIGTALLLALQNRGGVIENEPGEPIRLRLGAEPVEPFSLMDALANGQVTAEQWQAQVTSLGLTGLDLATVAPPAQ